MATVLTVIIFTIFTASTKDTTKEVARPKAATFVEAVNALDIVAVMRVARELPWDSLGRADSNFS